MNNLNPGKQAPRNKVREDDKSQRRNAVANQEKYWGKTPMLQEKDLMTNATFLNTASNANDFVAKLTEGLDKTAFPVGKW